MNDFRMMPPEGGKTRPPQALDGFLRAPNTHTSQPVRRETSRPLQRVSLNAPHEQAVFRQARQKQSRRSDGLPPKNLPLSRYVPPERPLRPVKKHRMRTWVLRSVSIFIALFLATGGFLFWKGYTKLHKVFRGTGTVAALTQNVDPNLLKGEGDGRVNILLLGIGGAGHDGPDLTDTMLVLSVDPVNNTAALLSVPRDLWVKQPTNFFGNYQKINATYESAKYSYLGKQDSSSANDKAVTAGFAADDQILEQVLGININYHVLVNFRAFKQAIDTVGGVTVDVKQQLYDPTMAWENHWNPVLAPVGIQTMNGTKALLYARSRETSSDFARTERQRQIIVALKDKVLTAGTLSNPAKIDGLMNAFGDNVYSDLSTQGASRLFGILKRVSDTKIQSIGLADPPHNFVTTDHVGNISVVRPRAGFNNYGEIQTYVRSQLPDGYLTKEHAPVVVVGPTPAAATAKAAELKTYGYNASASNVAYKGAFEPMTVIDLSRGKDKYTRHYLEQRFKVKAATSLPSDLNLGSSNAKFVIIVAQ